MTYHRMFFGRFCMIHFVSRLSFHMYSNNGTAFVGATNLMNKYRTLFLGDLKRQIVTNNAFQLVDWHFIPPGAPHMGFSLEAGVKSFKTYLKKIFHAQSLTYEEFSTVGTNGGLLEF